MSEPITDEQLAYSDSIKMKIEELE